MSSTVNSKGQLTLTKSVRDASGIKPGQKVRLLPMVDGTVLIIPLKQGIGHLAGILPKPGRAHSIEEMDAARDKAVGAHVLGYTLGHDEDQQP